MIDTICPKCGLPSPLDTRMTYWHCPHCDTKRELVHSERTGVVTYEYKVICLTGAATTSVQHLLNGLGKEGFRFAGMHDDLIILMREVKS